MAGLAAEKDSDQSFELGRRMHNIDSSGLNRCLLLLHSGKLMGIVRNQMYLEAAEHLNLKKRKDK